MALLVAGAMPAKQSGPKLRVQVINLASLVAIQSLAVGLLSAVLVFQGRINFEAYNFIFNVMTLIWFLSAPLWFVPALFGAKYGEAGKRAWLRPQAKN
jgi:uncharacterized RDD family membrane protein YckC